MKKILIRGSLFLLLFVLIIPGCSAPDDDPDAPDDDPEEFTWHYIGDTDEPSFVNGWQNWQNGFDVCAYGKDSNGFVHLKGTANNPSGYNGSYQIAFTLPEGYRPAEIHVYNVMAASSDNSALVYTYSNGNVSIFDTDELDSSALVSFDGITFFAEN